MTDESTGPEPATEPKQLQNGELRAYRLTLLKAATRSVIAIIIVGVGSYAIINQIEIPREAWYLGVAIVGALFGLDGVITYYKAHTDKER